MKKFFIQFAIFMCALFFCSEALWAKGDKPAETQKRRYCPWIGVNRAGFCKNSEKGREWLILV